jgi:hypothetical protein
MARLAPCSQLSKLAIAWSNRETLDCAALLGEEPKVTRAGSEKSWLRNRG